MRARSPTVQPSLSLRKHEPKRFWRISAAVHIGAARLMPACAMASATAHMYRRYFTLPASLFGTDDIRAQLDHVFEPKLHIVTILQQAHATAALVDVGVDHA